MLTNVALLGPADAGRLADLANAHGISLVLDLPWLYDPALSGFQPALSARDPAPHLVISTCRATAGTYPSPAAALRTTALARISALGPILRQQGAEVAAVRASSPACAALLQVGGLPVQVSGTLSVVAPRARDRRTLRRVS